jgi:hypothetical protein
MNNLYSILAKKGRGGDTQLRYVDGELAHVNNTEAEILDNNGLEGERLVKEHGSGTINPETGLKEYADPLTIIAGAKLAYDIGSNIFGTTRQGARNKGVRNVLRDQQRILRGAIPDIVERGKTLLEFALEGAGLREEDAFTDFLTKSENITRTSEAIAGQTGLALSGGILDELQRRQEDTSQEFSEDIRGLDLQAEKETANILAQTAEEQAAITQQILGIEADISRYS